LDGIRLAKIAGPRSITGKKGFVTLTKLFVKIGITKNFATTTKCLVLLTKRLVAAARFLFAATNFLSVVPNFVAVTKPFFSVILHRKTVQNEIRISKYLFGRR